MECQYCNKKKKFEEEANKPLIDKELKNKTTPILEIDRGKLVLWIDNLIYYKNDEIGESDCITSKTINYCPMCGKKLRRNNNVEN